jgi:hypothetical protein
MVVKHMSRILVVVCLSLIGTLGLVVFRTHPTATTPVMPTKMQTAAFTSIAHSALSKGHNTTWLIAPNGSAKLLRRSSSSASTSSIGSSSTSSVLCRADAFAQGTLPSSYIEEYVFKLPTGSSVLVGDFAGSAGAGDKSMELFRGLQYRSDGYDAVSLANANSVSVPFNGYFNLVFTAPKSC